VRAVVVFAAALALVVVPGAAAWTPLTPDMLENHTDPSVLRTPAGTELVAYSVARSGSLQLIRGSLPPQTIASGWPSIADPQLVQQGATTLLYVGGSTPGLALQGALRFGSSDGGSTWTGPLETNPSSTIGDIQAAAIRPDGTPLFSQDGTGFVNVYQGLNGELLHNAYPSCCGYAESFAVDSTGLAEIAFWSNFGRSQIEWMALDPGGGPTGAAFDLSGGNAEQESGRVPLVADASGNSYVGWVGGSVVNVTRITREQPNGNYALPTGAGARHLALTFEPRHDKLWIVWTRNGYLWAARARHPAGAFAPTVVKTRIPGGRTAYGVEAVSAGGSVDAYLNLGGVSGSGLWRTRLLPGMHVSVVRGRHPHAIVTDDLVPVAGAVLRGGERSVRTNTRGRASLKGFRHHAVVRVRHGGYAPTTFRVP